MAQKSTRSPGSVTVTEAIERELVPESGSRIIQMTRGDAIYHAIYSETSYADPSSRYFILDRVSDPSSPLCEVWRGDLQDQVLTFVADGILARRGHGVSVDQRYFFCFQDWSERSFTVLRTEIATLKQVQVRFEHPPFKWIATLMSVAPDNRTFYTGACLGPHRWGVVKYDLESARMEVIHEGGDDIFNCHVQVEPGKGEDLMIQHNRGAVLDDQGNQTRPVGSEGATLYLIDTNGGNLRRLPVGKPYTWPIQGHQVWLGTTGGIVFTTGHEVDAEDAMAQGVIRVIRPGDSASRVLATGHLFHHPSMSEDARFFVTETGCRPDWEETSLIVVGSIKTGRVRVLCDSGARNEKRYACPEPYFTPDCRWVIYNSDRTGTAHIYAATVPAGMLEELDEG